jgi:hypothetical protein
LAWPSWRFSMSQCPWSHNCAGRALDLRANKASGSVVERWLSSHAHRCRDDKLVSRLATFTPISDGSLLGLSGSGGNAVNQRRGPLRTPCAAGLRQSCQPSGAKSDRAIMVARSRSCFRQFSIHRGATSAHHEQQTHQPVPGLR